MQLMEPACIIERRRRVEEIAEALPVRAATLARLFMSHATVQISRTELGVLNVLSEAPQRITKLAAHEGVTQPAMTLLVDRLERRGLVHRARDPLDGRAVLVRLTPAGQELFDQLRAEYRALVHEDVVTLADADVDALARAVE